MMPPSTTIEILDVIRNHVGEVVDETVIGFHVTPPAWDKWVNDVPWNPDLAVNVQTWDVFTVTDVISTHSAVAIVEHWNPEQLTLAEYSREPEVGIVLSDPGFLSWEFPEGAPGAITLTKVYAVQPCTWTYSVLWEELWVEDVEWERRPVQVDKRPSSLWIDGVYDPQIPAWGETTFTLHYGNAGGLENRAWISVTLPAELAFVRSDPPPMPVDPGGRWAQWDAGIMETDGSGTIAVTVKVVSSLPPGTPIHVLGAIYDHADIVRDEALVAYMRRPTVYLPLVVRNASQ